MARAALFLTVLAAIGSMLMAGTFFAFSTFVMKGLARIPAPDGIRAMQGINLAVVPSLFVAVFVGTAVVALALAAMSLTGATPSWARHAAIAGSALYLVGVIGVSAAFNIPRNDALASLDPASAGAAEFWARYVAEWTQWNHVRTVASLLAAVAFIARLIADVPETWLRR